MSAQKNYVATENSLEKQLNERIKELNCLYSLTRLIEENENSIDTLLQQAVDLLPSSWQYPELACARIVFKKASFQSKNFKMTSQQQQAPLLVFGEPVGLVEVYYRKKMPTLDEGPFLKEERLLIDAVSDHIAKAIQRITAQRQLLVERQALQDANVALHDSLVQSKQEKKMVGASIQAKIDKIITPIFYALEADMDERQKKYLGLLKKNFLDIVSPFVEGKQDILTRLSPVEVMICDMIKHGLSSKEIAKLRGTTPGTVGRHRENIRHKLGLANRKINLVSYLNNTLEE
ncbi:regulatory protein, luxR family [Malonomonas rubra DSM 5091]|uniref:Regulatory protein, luxR family n=1 Tax=Malonomonas rubra DSM 5091 TaxID=1122189 RepID=A0A1M6G616_MALRU|nr:helix-turn-helix transcriptional regulator [Malonomonas rubra]SHJ05340.1 regulatory protein, luxR family [Malonomonas rubra DSM 5091]